MNAYSKAFVGTYPHMTMDAIIPYMGAALGTYFIIEVNYLYWLVDDIDNTLPSYATFKIIKNTSKCSVCNYKINSRSNANFLKWAVHYNPLPNTPPTVCPRCAHSDVINKYITYLKSNNKSNELMIFVNDTQSSLRASGYYTKEIVLRIDKISRDFTDCLNKIVQTRDRNAFFKVMQFLAIFPTVSLPTKFLKTVNLLKHGCTVFGIKATTPIDPPCTSKWQRKYAYQIYVGMTTVKWVLFPQEIANPIHETIQAVVHRVTVPQKLVLDVPPKVSVEYSISAFETNLKKDESIEYKMIVKNLIDTLKKIVGKPKIEFIPPKPTLKRTKKAFNNLSTLEAL